MFFGVVLKTRVRASKYPQPTIRESLRGLFGYNGQELHILYRLDAGQDAQADYSSLRAARAGGTGHHRWDYGDRGGGLVLAHVVEGRQLQRSAARSGNSQEAIPPVAKHGRRYQSEARFAAVAGYRSGYDLRCDALSSRGFRPERQSGEPAGCI